MCILEGYSRRGYRVFMALLQLAVIEGQGWRLAFVEPKPGVMYNKVEAARIQAILGLLSLAWATSSRLQLLILSQLGRKQSWDETISVIVCKKISESDTPGYVNFNAASSRQKQTRLKTFSKKALDFQDTHHPFVASPYRGTRFHGTQCAQLKQAGFTSYTQPINCAK